jgi:hypothetical protein
MHDEGDSLSNVSWAAVPLPLDLSPLGLTNCSLRVSRDVSDALFGALGQATQSARNAAARFIRTTRLSGIATHRPSHAAKAAARLK